MKGSAILVSVLVVAVLVGGYFYFRDTSAPGVSLSPEGRAVSGKSPLTLVLEDGGAGLKNVQVTALQGDKTISLLDLSYEPGIASKTEQISLEKAGLQEGPVQIRVRAGDRAVYHFLAGNVADRTYDFVFDSKPPVISVLSTAHNFNRGGAGLILYTVSEEPERTGVTVGERFFPGYRLESGIFASLFAFPYDMELKDFAPRLAAVDQAGNERQAGFYYHANPRTLPKDKINLSRSFLEQLAPEFESQYPEVTDPLERFLKVNRELRAQNEGVVESFGMRSEPRLAWNGTFLRMANAATRGNFAEERTYFYEGKPIDRQFHLGIDLASLAQSPVPAANAGTVLFAENLGIYGQCIIIDHGLGLQTLYGHLSSIQVNVGDVVSRGQIVGRSGATGLAGGDHLHYAVLVAGLPVNPLEWWDENWIRNNITSKLEETRSRAAR